MDSVDKAFWVLPVLGFLDVVSTLYMMSLGYHPKVLEVGLFARVSGASGFAYGFAVLYLFGLTALAYALWYVKGKLVDPRYSADKAVFLLLVVILCILYVGVTTAFAGNLLLPYITDGSISQMALAFLLYSSTAFSLGLYIWHDVVAWVRTDGGEKK